MVRKQRVLLSCEHGGNRVPPAYRTLFLGAEELLASHAGYDAGALDLAKRLANGLQVPLVAATTTRLLVDLNRSPGSRNLFSAITRNLAQSARRQLLETHYTPYRTDVRERLTTIIGNGEQAIHLSVHSFTPVWHGQARNADLGLLYDPARTEEATFCRNWQRLLQQRHPELRIRCNYPYRGTADGLVRSLRRSFNACDYLGIELEINQALLKKNRVPDSLRSCLQDTLRALSPSPEGV